MVPVTFENVPTAFKRWARFILPRVTGKCNVRARTPMCNLPKSSKCFSSRTTSRIGSKSSLCNSPGESLYVSERSAVIRCSVPEISRGRRDTHTHSTSIKYIDNYNYIFCRWFSFLLKIQNKVLPHNFYGMKTSLLIQS